jgi:hypothetical protein
MPTASLERRLEKAAALVGAGGGSGCAVCAAWPKLVAINDWRDGPVDPHPVRCPACGRSRQVVEFVRDWRRRE